MRSAAQLKGKRALVTGATGGIGRAIVSALAGYGVRVIATAKNHSRLQELAAAFADLVIIPADLALEDEVQRLADESLARFGGLDILINNAGLGIKKPLVDMPATEVDLTLAVNLKAPIMLAARIGRAMAQAGGGHIINIGSGASYTPLAGYVVYCASKYGLLGFSESLALELREYGVKVSIIMPGSTATWFGGAQPQKRLQAQPGILLPEDVADSVIYLLSQSPRAWTSQLNLRPLRPDVAPNE